MTYEKFLDKLNQIGEITKLECGEDKEEQEVSLTGEQGVALAQRMFPRKK